MARDGINPSRSRTTDYHPARVTVAVLPHLPHQTGYFESRLDVTRMTIESILANTGMPFDLWVFDNGSCAPVVDYLRGLRDEGRITQLILSSKNIGKPAALQTIFKACQSEIIAYTDDDVFFLPGWLEEHVRIIDTYPNVGAVTGFYIRERMKNGIDSTLAFLDQPGVATERGLLMPAIWEEEYRVNSGRSQERYNAEWLLENQTGLVLRSFKDIVAAVRTLDEALDSPEVHASGMVRSVPHPLRPDFRMLANPLRFNGERLAQRVCSPLGADNADLVPGVPGEKKGHEA